MPLSPIECEREAERLRAKRLKDHLSSAFERIDNLLINGHREMELGFDELSRGRREPGYGIRRGLESAYTKHGWDIETAWFIKEGYFRLRVKLKARDLSPLEALATAAE